MSSSSDDVWRAYQRAYRWNFFLWSVLGGSVAMAGLLIVALTARANPVGAASIFVVAAVFFSFVLYSADVRAIRAKYLGRARGSVR